MATYTLRPNANWSGSTSFSNTGGTSEFGVLADDSDATFLLRDNAYTSANYEAEFDTVTLGADERVTSVNLLVRYKTDSPNAFAQFSIGAITDRNSKTTSYSIPITKSGSASISTVDLGILLTSSPSGSEWNQDLIDNLIFRFTDGASAPTSLAPPSPIIKTTLYEVSIVVETAPRPTLTVSTPTGTVTTSSFPAVTWVKVADGSTQSAYEVKIFDATTYGGASFNASTSSPTVTTGIVLSDESGAPLTVDLANDTVYRAYVRVANSVNGVNYFSDWAYSQFTMAINSPATPQVSAIYNSTNEAVAITILGRTNILSENQASFETSTAGWISVSNCVIARVTTQHSSGSASLSVTASSGGDMTTSTTDATKFTISPNYKFSALASFKSGSTARACSVGIIWLDSASAVLSTSYGTASNDSSSAWSEKTVSATAPATALYAQVIVKIEGASSSEVHYVDEVALHAGDNPTWTRGGFSNLTFVVERSTDSFATFSAVRGSPVTADSGQIAVVNDYEFSVATPTTYRAKARGEI